MSQICSAVWGPPPPSALGADHTRSAAALSFSDLSVRKTGAEFAQLETFLFRPPLCAACLKYPTLSPLHIPHVQTDPHGAPLHQNLIL